MAGEVPFRRSLLARLVATSILIVVCSTAATAWLAVQSTTTAFEQAQGRALSDDALIYDEVVGFAATHPTWEGVGRTVEELARRTGRRIVLSTPDRQVIATSGSAPDLPGQASAEVDPLNTDPALKPDAVDNIDPRAVGPYALTRKERDYQHAIADELVACYARAGYPATVEEAPSGRHTVRSSVGPAGTTGRMPACADNVLRELTPTEAAALVRLNDLIADCLERQDLKPIRLDSPADRRLAAGTMPEPELSRYHTCIRAGYVEQLRPHVAPVALLFVLSPGGVSTTRFNLSRDNLTRIIGVTVLVLTITIAVTALVAARLIRPLRALTAAAQDPDARPAHVGDRGEIGVLAAALNDLAERRRRADAQRRDLVRDAAHELRTPLTNIRSWLEASEDGLATPLSDPALTGALLREAVQLQHLVDDLQDLAAADSGRFPLHPEPVRVADLLDQIATAHGGNADAGGIALATRTSGDPTVTADPVRLRQAIGNLVANALRYTPAGGRVAVHGRPVDGAIELEVSDTGTGIAAEDLPHVFDRFWRADRSRTRETGGSGLGLAIVKQIVDAHRGTVTVASRPGRGTTFTVRLPATPGRARRSRAAAR